MDPSCTLGFYCHTLEDFKSFQQQAEKVSILRVYKNIQEYTIVYSIIIHF